MNRLLLVTFGLLLAIGGRAQGINDPSTWTTKVVPVKDGYDIVFHVELKPEWHIWALDAGGDGMMIPTAITFEKGDCALVGSVREEGKLVVTDMDGIDGKVRYYSGKADFIQTVRGKSGDNVKGSYTYQLCNESICLPPRTQTFSVSIP